MRIPKKLEACLPLASKPKLESSKKKKRGAPHEIPRSLIVEPAEKKACTLLQQINTMRKEKVRVKQLANAAKRAKYDKKKQQVDKIFAPHVKEDQRRKLAKAGMEQEGKCRKLGGGLRAKNKGGDGDML